LTTKVGRKVKPDRFAAVSIRKKETFGNGPTAEHVENNSMMWEVRRRSMPRLDGVGMKMRCKREQQVWAQGLHLR